MSQNFHVGQRTISEAEPELGLGIIIHTEINRIEVDFPALEEPRLYARREAPLKRLVLYAGDSFPHADGRELVVEASENQGELLIYLAVDDQGQQHVVPEADIARYMPINQPRQRLLTGQLDGNRWFDLRIRSLEAKHRLESNNFQGLLGARASLLDHQLYVAQSATRGDRTRVLLSDEVGLGKTIEAGLILQRLIQRQAAKRALIVVPEALQHQWLVEMLRRFNIRCKLIVDNESPEEDDPRDLMAAIFASSDETRIDDHSHWIVAIERLAFDEDLVGELHAANFDTLIVDEAHRLQWSAQGVSDEYQIIEGLAEQSKHVMLLTATPTQFGLDGHFARLRLLDPIRYTDLEAYTQEQQRYQEVAAWARPLIDGETLSPALRDKLSTALADEDSRSLLASPKLSTEQSQIILNRLVDRLGTGRAVYRNTRQSVGGFAPRELHLAVLEDQEPDPNSWWRSDARVSWLIKTLRKDPKRRFVLIGNSAETALDLSEAIRVLAGLPIAVFHEGMSIVECDRAAAFFADDEDGAQILLCSSIGAEGRNFQFVSDIVIFDLPSEPDALEQCIGRVDRIGQLHAVKIHVPVIENSPQHRLATWYHDVLNAFEKSCAYGALVMEDFGFELDAALHDNDALARLIATARPKVEAIALDYQQGRDRLLEWHSLQPALANELVESISSFETQHNPWPWFEQAADCYGLDIEDLGGDRFFVKISEHAEQSHFDGLETEGNSFASKRHTAIAREDLGFLSWEHPLVNHLLQDISSGDRGKACLASLSDPGLKPGEIFIEGYFVPELPYARPELSRALPASMHRVMLTLSGMDITARVAPSWIRVRAKGIKKTMARQLAESRRDDLKNAVLKLEKQSSEIEIQWRQQANEKLHDDYKNELSRQQGLGADPASIAQLEKTLNTDLQAITQLSLRFEALRIILTH